MNYPYDLGPYSRTVTTCSADAQRSFDRGLNWCFGYHHEEAVACFEKALESDPNCAMAHWGVAYAAGPNYNFPWELMDPRVGRRARPRLWLRLCGTRIDRGHHCAGTRADRGAAGPLSTARPHRRPETLERRLCRRHAPCAPGASQRPRSTRHLCGGDPQPYALADVGPSYRRARRRRRHDRGARGARRGGWYGAVISVTYAAGYSLLEDLPRPIGQACLLLLRHRWMTGDRDPTIRAEMCPA